MFGLETDGLAVPLGLFFLFLILLYWYSVYPYSVLEQCGIKHPKPVPFFGNMMLFQNGFFNAHKDLINQYGKVCGYYLGRRPVVVVADPDMLRQIMVKEFHNFTNRMNLRTATKPVSESVLLLRDDRWRRVRSILTPSFSAARMKEMVPLINTATETLLNNLSTFAESGESVDIHRCFGCFTMDVIASVAFGIQVDSQKDPENPFVHHASKFFSFSFFRPIMFIFMAFPFLIGPLRALIPNKGRDEMNSFFINSIQKIIKQRDELPASQRRRDFLQLMLDVRSGTECASLEHFDVVNHETVQANVQGQRAEEPDDSPAALGHESPRHAQSKRMMTEDEIIGQAFIFLVAGYETSSNTLAFVCYLLAIHPRCQEKLQREVDDFYTKYGSADYSNVQELKYLDMVVCEALRLYPPGFRFAREVEHNCWVNGQFLPKGVTIEIAAGFLHHDPEHWTEPEKFIPERSETFHSVTRVWVHLWHAGMDWM
ncbi:thromboxane-A synthase isoform X2 [Brachyhypopomus gauderio]|uniref:thromboxane-A synthase isoform X2 n=1 Tax=Brachyhypopomus gauderio TaxID=698409 RepID=UPI0040421ACB